MTAITVENLQKSYGDKVAVADVSFDVQRGEVFALLGPNGAGKTTTIEILEGFRQRSSGQVETLGVDPADKSTQRWLRTRIGVVLQELAVEPFYSVRQVLTRNAGYYPSPRSGRRGHLVGRAWTRRPMPGSRPCPAASSEGSMSASASWAIRNCCSSTSPPPGSTRRVDVIRGS